MNWPLGALAVAGMLLLAGCGDERKEFREDKLAPLQQEVKDQRARIAATLQQLELGDAEQARELEAEVARLGEVHQVIASLDPPDGLDDEFKPYVDANTRISKHLERYAALVKANEREGLRKAANAAQRAMGDADLARVDLDYALRREQ